MPKKSDDLDSAIDGFRQALLAMPWWGGLPVLALVWAGFAFAVPTMLRQFGGSPAHPPGLSHTIADISSTFAPLITIAVAALWVGTLFIRASDRSRLNAQRSMDELAALHWREFERLLASAFRAQGYAARETPSGADGGVDLVLQKDRRTTIVQAKHWKSRNVGVKVVREVAGVASAEGAHDAIVVAGGGFTVEARRFASKSGVRLIGGAELLAMIQEVQRPKRRATPPSQECDPQAARSQKVPNEPVIGETPNCPTCATPMVLRTAKRGSRVGQQFWGCSDYPRCRGTRQVR